MRLVKAMLSAALVAALSLVAVPATGATGSHVVDSYCSPSGDYCTQVVKKADGTIVFGIRAFADYFGKATACVTKVTRVCHSTTARKDTHGLYLWNIRWQGNYPKEGPGQYKVRWSYAGGSPIGEALYFDRG